MNATRRGWVTLPFMLYMLSMSRDSHVLCFVPNPCTGSGITFQRRDSHVMSYNLDFLVDIYSGLFETERLADEAKALLERNIKNPSHLRYLNQQPHIESLYAENLDIGSTDRALRGIYDTLDRIMVFISHTDQQILRINYTKLQEPIKRSLIMLKQGETTGGLYFLMCRIMLRLPQVADSGRSIGLDIIPYYLHGVSRAQVFDNAYITLLNIERVLTDLRQELGGLVEALTELRGR